MPAETEKRKRIAEAAVRASDEAAARRNAHDTARDKTPREIAGRGGLEPVRYGDWEVRGIATDF